MKRTAARAWLAYASVAVGVTVVAFLAAMLAPAPARQAVQVAAGVALGVQLFAFALLILLRGQPQLFLVGWLIGLVLRFGVVGVGAYLLTQWPCCRSVRRC